MEVNLNLEGADNVNAKLDHIARGGEVAEGLKKATLLTDRYVKQFTPVDTGRLRASILPEFFGEGKDFFGVVGTDVLYAIPVEEGTRPHWVPPHALDAWASRHGVDSSFAIRKAIALRGTRGWHMFQQAVEQMRGELPGVCQEIAVSMCAYWQSPGTAYKDSSSGAFTRNL